MRKIIVLLVILIFVFMGISVLPLKFDIAKAIGTIYIRADGSVDPPTAPIQRTGNMYTFIGNVYGPIVVERDSIVVDGAGYTVQGAGDGSGIDLSGRSNVTIKNAKIKTFDTSVYLNESSNNTILGNNITNSTLGMELDYYSDYNSISGNYIAGDVLGAGAISLGQGSCSNKIRGNEISGAGISLMLLAKNNSIWENSITEARLRGIYFQASSDYNSVVGNNITRNHMGIWVSYSANNSISGNSVSANDCGIFVEFCSNNSIFHNNFVENQRQTSTYYSYSNLWDNGVEGNFWSNYTGADNNQDGIGDSSYVIDRNNTDNHPLMGQFSDFNATREHHVQIVCNSTISDFQFGGTEIRFKVSGVEGTKGFCRTCIPTALMHAPYKVFVNGTEVPANLLPSSNSTHTYLYFNYNHTTQEIVIIPEFRSLFILPLFMIGTLLTITVCRRKRSSKPRSFSLCKVK